MAVLTPELERLPDLFVPRSGPRSFAETPRAADAAPPGAWPREPYRPVPPAAAAGAAPEAARTPPDADPSRAVPAATAPDETLVPLEDPRVRGRILDRLEDEIAVHMPDVLVASGYDPAGIAAVLADRTGLPLLLGGAVLSGSRPSEALEGLRAAVVGETLRAAPVADLVRALEQDSASVVAIVGVSARDGDEMSMLSNHYNVFYIIPLD